MSVAGLPFASPLEALLMLKPRTLRPRLGFERGG